MAILKQKTSFGPGIYRGNKFDIERLRRFAEGTNKAIAAGVPIPLLKRHAPINADDAVTNTAAKLEGAGWVTKVDVDESGALAWEAKDVPDDVAALVEKGTARFTSPEFRDHYECEKAGVYTGPVIRHFAFTPTPGNPHQGPIEALALSEDPKDQARYKDLLLLRDLSFPVLRAPGEGMVSMSVGAKQQAPDIGCFQFDETDFEAPITDEQTTQHDEDPTVKKKFPDEHEEASVPATGEDASIDKPNAINDDDEWEVDEDIPEGETGGESSKLDADQDGSDDDDEDEEKKKKKQADNAAEFATAMGGDTSQHAEAHPYVRESRHHKYLTKKGYQYKSSGQGGWDHYYEHPTTGDEMKLSFNSSNDTQGIRYRRKRKKPTTQHAEFVDATPSDATRSRADSATPLDDQLNPDMPPVVTNNLGKLRAILAGMNQLGLVLPSDFDFMTDTAYDVLLAAINTKIKSDQEAEAEAAMNAPVVEEPVRESAMPFSEGNFHVFMRGGSIGGDKSSHHPDHGAHIHSFADEEDAKAYATRRNKQLTPGERGYYGIKYHVKHADKLKGWKLPDKEAKQFSEQELEALPENMRKVVLAGQKALEEERKARLKAEAEAAQFAEQERQTRNDSARSQSKDVINKAKIPPALRTSLLASYETIQFEEGEEQPTFTAVQVAKMVSDSMPPALQFLEDMVKVADTPLVRPKIGVDAHGKAVYGPGSSEQFFEGEPVPSGHIDPARAEEIVRGNPVLKMPQAPAWRPPDLSKTVAENTAKNPSRVMNN